MKTIYKVTIAAGITILTLTVIAGYSWWCVESHPVSKKKIAQLSVEMPAIEVQKILGKPWKEHRSSDGSFDWLYGSANQWYYFTVEFSSASNLVKYYEDD